MFALSNIVYQYYCSDVSHDSECDTLFLPEVHSKLHPLRLHSMNYIYFIMKMHTKVCIPKCPPPLRVRVMLVTNCSSSKRSSQVTLLLGANKYRTISLRNAVVGPIGRAKNKGIMNQLLVVYGSFKKTSSYFCVHPYR